MSDSEMDIFDVDSMKEEIRRNSGQENDSLAERDMMPAYGSEGWNEYVMSRFMPGELFDGNPTCAGLRRVAEELLGDIVVSRPAQVWPASDSDGPGRATVLFEVVIDWMNSGNLRTYGEVADTWHGNTDDLFCAHPVATASTRAEGRALRKALKVKCIAAEELAKKDVASIVRQSVESKEAAVPTSGTWHEDESISNAQVNFIDSKCKQLNIDVMGFINAGSGDYETINDIKKSTAAKMLAELNRFQTGSKEVPSEITGYNQQWRK